MIDVNTELEYSAIISYKVPIERIQNLIPKPFKLWTFIEDLKEYALVSAVQFIDKINIYMTSNKSKAIRRNIAFLNKNLRLTFVGNPILPTV